MPHISHSGLSKFNACPFKYKIRYILGAESPGSIYTVFGKAVHATIENILLGKLTNKDEIKKRIQAMARTAMLWALPRCPFRSG